MKNSKFKKVISVILLLLVLFNVGSQTFAAINTTYGNPAPVDDFAVEEKLKSSSIMEPIALFFYSIASWLEGLIGGVFESLTGTNEFPWADKVIFNTVAFLDVNFLNPAPGSLFLTSEAASEPLKDTPLATIVQKSYSTVMVLCIGFLGVIVGIMAIKLAITTIASEKAKYKQAIVQFATSLVLLFCMHYGISLIFYINEQIVIVASKMLKDNIEESNLQINLEMDSLDSETRVENFLNQNTSNNKESKEYIRNNVDIASYLIENPTYESIRLKNASDESWVGDKLDVGGQIDAVNNLYNDISIIKGENGKEEDWELISEYLKLPESASNDEIKKIRLYSFVRDLAIRNLEIQNRNDNGYNPSEEEIEKESLSIIKGQRNSYKIMQNARRIFVLPPEDPEHMELPDRGKEPFAIITDMASFFKESAWSYDTDESGQVTGWKASKINYEGAFLYVIFFVQSLAFFIAYIKRFFYVVILALLAPAVILYDFFVKSLAL